ncbi:Y-family DNA polymerase [Polaromonas sp. CG_9.11]|uniref:Y-family DNA polymerase n=1 Tax=Polaromonas sp. CG_9.11 TaxID=2787730 RepID=UPI0018CB8039|nr:Y-family DNA polymerase [Polaromonas sp. CG_9.11]MBG6078246.1 DNA polymerase V [Polaromonas sp. CG_9.11]
MFALVDGNNFYVSCERAFRPILKTRPVVVLSNNDGCAIARSNEAKAIGIKMGQPWFECRQLAEEHGVIALSANFTLYGDMSDRMMGIAAGLGPGQEIYSIDESFIDLSGVRGDLTARGQQVRQRILEWIGIPTGIGMGPTKTLAKLANHVAKSADRKPGSYPVELARVCNLGALPASDLDAVFEATAVGEVWGIGRRIAQQLTTEGITNVLQLVQISPSTIRSRWSVVLERTVRELQGQPCMTIENQPSPKKEIAFTRSFGQPITDLKDLAEAVSAFASGASFKLRQQNSLAAQIHVFIHTSPFRPGPRINTSTTVPLRRPTADSNLLVAAAVMGLRHIYRPGFDYIKAGIMLMDLQADTMQQGELDLENDPADDRSKLMRTVDQLNDRYGRGTLKVASEGLAGDKRAWSMRQQLRTPHYTTDWKALPVAKAG